MQRKAAHQCLQANVLSSCVSLGCQKKHATLDFGFFTCRFQVHHSHFRVNMFIQTSAKHWNLLFVTVTANNQRRTSSQTPNSKTIFIRGPFKNHRIEHATLHCIKHAKCTVIFPKQKPLSPGNQNEWLSCTHVKSADLSIGTRK